MKLGGMVTEGTKKAPRNIVEVVGFEVERDEVRKMDQKFSQACPCL